MSSLIPAKDIQTPGEASSQKRRSLQPKTEKPPAKNGEASSQKRRSLQPKRELFKHEISSFIP
jgi:hypothetical protein